MDDAACWALVDSPGGVVDALRVPRPEVQLNRLTAAEREDFVDRTDELVEGLLSDCPLPASHEGDTAEWRLVADGELRAAQLRVPVAWVLAQETRRSAYATAAT